ncbi:OmpA family protein [Rhodoferax sp. UBA5149]|uniref:OmpA family protein n=1 Tax=Rhodoferax sp. UBA5149 TaxID=1947379 RepID=UPI0025D6D7E6|nr:OmpA family protein [Rhodoferax sp. UBA5149]
MKKEIRLALWCLAATSVPAFAQNAVPPCGAANFDQTRNAFTIVNPAADSVNQQCILTVYPRGTASEQTRQFPALYPIEGSYLIELSGGGGGGGGGASRDQGGGGGGAGATPSRTVQYLAPGMYKLTIGMGGSGGSANGGRTEAGNPTSLTVASTGRLVAGFAGADVWRQRTQAAGDGSGGMALAGGSSGGSGGAAIANSGAKVENLAQSGSLSQTPGYTGVAGQSGSESGRSAQTKVGNVVQANAGGGGGASVGSGGAGESVSRDAVAGIGDLGGGGGGGRGGMDTADSGGRGGHGFIRLTMAEPAPQQMAAPVIVALAPVTQTVQRYSLSTDALFAFGKSTLKPVGEARLDDLANKLREVNISSITYTGHADRIGSSDANQRLSEGRAESVKTYLASRGVQYEHVQVVGMGETQPVTSSDACRGPVSAKVIACLQPDRRVDIDVAGTDKK